MSRASPPPALSAPEITAPGPEATPIPATVVRAAVARIQASRCFSGFDRLKDLLSFLVEETLAGREDRLDPPAVGRAVFVPEHGPDLRIETDPQLGTIVRVEAGRLRTRLHEYYAFEGLADPIRIELPRGTLAPTFARAAPVRRGDAPAEPPRGAAPLPVPERRPATHRPWRAGVVATLGLVAILGGAVPLLWPTAGPAPIVSEAVASLPRGPRVLILPFVAEESAGEASVTDPAPTEPASVAPALARDLARGIAGELVADLRQARELFVFAPATGGAVGAEAGDLGAVRDRLGVRFVVAGSLGPAADRLKLAVTLDDVAREQRIWAESFELSPAVHDLARARHEVAERLVRLIGRAYDGADPPRTVPARRAAPASLPAQACVANARWYRSDLDPAYRAAMRACLHETTRAQPELAAAWAYRALFALDETRFGLGLRDHTAGALAPAQTAAREAVGRDPTLAVAWAAEADLRYFAGDLDGFREAAARALERDPNDPDLLADLGAKIALSGGWAEGISLVRKAQALDPFHPPPLRTALALAALRAGRADEALAQARAIPDSEAPDGPLLRAVALHALGHKGQAAEAAGELHARFPGLVEGLADSLRFWNVDPVVARLLEGTLRQIDPTPKPAG